MSVRSLKFDVSAACEPQLNERVWGGMQYEDNATEFCFKPDAELLEKVGEDALFRIDLNGISGYDPSENLSADGEGYFARLLPYSMTRYGGEIEVVFVISKNDIEILSYPITVYLTAVQRDTLASQELYTNISSMEQSVKEMTESVENHTAETRQSYEEVSVMHNELRSVYFSAEELIDAKESTEKLVEDINTSLANGEFKGDKGDKGDTGAVGPIGPQGPEGIQGEKGDKGDKGDRGDQGIQGIQGEKGDKGEQGIQGEKGDKGDTGDVSLQYANNTFSNALKGSESGPTFLINDVSPVEHTVEVKVKTKNLLPYPYLYTTATTNGITFTDNGDGSITVNGTATSAASFYFWNTWGDRAGKILIPELKDGNTYTFSGFDKATHPNSLMAIAYKNENSETKYWYGHNGWASSTFEWSDDYFAEIVYLQIGAGDVFENEVIKPQIELGAMATDYTPYIADLSTVKVRKCGKNLLPYPYLNKTTTTNGITFTDNGDGSITINGTATSTASFYFWNTWGDRVGKILIPELKDGNTYTFSGLDKAKHPNSSIQIAYKNENGETRYWYGHNGRASSTLEWSDDYFAEIVYLQIGAGDVFENEVIKPQIELGAMATEYEPYIEPTEYTVNADGTVDGVTSIYPNMTLSTDTEGVLIDCAYNRDLNKSFAEVLQRLAALEAAAANS